MAKPIPKSHGTPFAPRKGAAISTRGRKNAPQSPVARLRLEKPASHPGAPKESVASALLGRAQQENPSVSGGSMGSKARTTQAPESGDLGMTVAPAAHPVKRGKRIVSTKRIASGRTSAR